MTNSVRGDLYAQNIHGVFADLIRIKLSDNTYVNLAGSDTAVISNGVTYDPAGFELVEPDKASTDEGTGTLTLVGVTDEHITMVQNAVAPIYMTMAFVRIDDPDTYLLYPTEYEVDTCTISSANGTMSITMKTMGTLGFYASGTEYNPSNFPGLEG